MKNKIYPLSQHNWFYRLYLVGFFVILALPLLNSRIYFSPFNWSKTVVFQAVFSIILFVFLCQTLWRKNEGIFDRIKKIHPVKSSEAVISRKAKLFNWVNMENIAFWILLLLFAVNLLATIFSLDPSRSFFGFPDRGGGFINYGFYILFAIIAFLVIKKEDWHKLWNWAIFIGSLVSLIAVISWLRTLINPNFGGTGQLSATIGGQNTLALYLMLLALPTLSFIIQAKTRVKKSFYILALSLFCFVTALTISQGAYLGLIAGFLYFILFYPNKSKKLLYFKLALVACAIIIAATAIFIKNNPQYSINKNYVFEALTHWKMDQCRLSVWKVAFKAFSDRPLLGYGPENFYIGFDRHYNPSLPKLQSNLDTHDSWYDKAHNFALNMLVETGIVGFIPFILLFGFLSWGLYKLAYRQQEDNHKKIISHGFVSAFAAYFANLMFNFENFSSYIIVFFIVGYALSLIIKRNQTELIQSKPVVEKLKILLFKSRKAIAGVAFLGLIFFIWFFNAKPLLANAQINKSLRLSYSGNCDRAVAIADNELKNHSIIDGYIRIKYISTLGTCIQIYPDRKLIYAPKIIEAIKENTNIMPYYTRNWLILSTSTNQLAASEKDEQKKKELIVNGKSYLEKAKVLSPNREELIAEEINFYISDKDYQSAKKTSDECMDKYPNLSTCYWYLGLSQIYLAKNSEELAGGKANVEKAQTMGFPQSLANFPLFQLAATSAQQKNFLQLEWTYEKLTEFNPKYSEYFGTLALMYKQNKKEDKAKEALKEMLLIQSCVEKKLQSKLANADSTASFIENILGLKKENPRYHYILYHLYVEMGDFEKAREEAQKYYDTYTVITEVKNNPTLLAKAKTDLDALLAKASAKSNEALCDKYK